MVELTGFMLCALTIMVILVGTFGGIIIWMIKVYFNMYDKEKK